MKKRFMVLLTFILLLTSTSSVFAYSLFGGKFSSKYIKYAIETSVPTSYVAPIQNAASMWYNSTHVYLTQGGSNVITVYAYGYGNTGWDGVSFMNPSWTSSTYTYGTIQLNRTYADSYSDLHKKLVTCHEFGHELGLAHVSSYVMMYKSDVWNAYLSNNSLANSPAQDDINGVNSLY